MNITLWIVTALLALLLLAAGTMKIVQPKAKLAAAGQGWAEDFSDGTVKGIGGLEVLAALGLVLPSLLNIATILAFSEGENDSRKALVPLAFAVLVPAAAYLLAWLWFRFRNRGQTPNSGSEH